MRSKTVLLSSIAAIGLMSWAAPAAAEEAPASPPAPGQEAERKIGEKAGVPAPEGASDAAAESGKVEKLPTRKRG